MDGPFAGGTALSEAQRQALNNLQFDEGVRPQGDDKLRIMALGDHVLRMP